MRGSPFSLWNTLQNPYFPDRWTALNYWANHRWQKIKTDFKEDGWQSAVYDWFVGIVAFVLVCIIAFI